MKSFSNVITLFVLGSLLSLLTLADSPSAKIKPEELQIIPDGNYLLTIEHNGKPQRLNLKMQGNRATCVKAEDPSLAQVEGRFQLHHPGAFLGRFRGGIDSQLWIFRPDGTAAVREVPDRGEQQTAVPVKGDSLNSPTAK